MIVVTFLVFGQKIKKDRPGHLQPVRPETSPKEYSNLNNDIINRFIYELSNGIWIPYFKIFSLRILISFKKRFLLSEL